MTRKMTQDEMDIIAQYPVRQNHHTGKWGYARVCDCIDLNKCIYQTERAATIARNRFARMSVDNPEGKAI